MPLWTLHGQPIALGPEIKAGAEGRIHEVIGQQMTLAKVYHQLPSTQKWAKLNVLSSIRTAPLHRIAALPADLLRDERGNGVGFLMPRAPDGFLEVHELYDPRSRLRRFPEATWDFMVHVAMNAARVFAQMHDQGIIIGDVNHSNLLVNQRGHVYLIDCDSVQVRDGGRVYHCGVGTPEYVPPELQNLNLSLVDRTEDHDAFGFAVLAFQLLMLGCHPYAGRRPGRDSADPAELIARSIFAHGAAARAAGIAPPPHVPKLHMLGSTISALFEATFVAVGQGRPRPAQWISALAELAGSITRCNAERGHFYLQGLQGCPWCVVESRIGPIWPRAVTPTTGQAASFTALWERVKVLYGNLKLPSRARPSFDVAGMWAAILQVPAPADQELVLPLEVDPDPAPHLVTLARHVLGRQAVQWVITLAILAGVIAVLINAGICLGALAGLAATHLLSPIWKRRTGDINEQHELAISKAKAEYLTAVEADKRATSILEAAARANRFHGKLRTLERQRDELMRVLRDWDQSVSITAMPEHLQDRNRQLQGLHLRLTGLSAKRNEAWQRLQQGAHESRLRRYLQTVPLPDPGVIEGIGTGKIAILRSYRITCAADITLERVLAVPGIADVLASRLLVWRAGIAGRFQFQPNAGPDPQDVADLDRDIERERAALENQLFGGCQAMLQALTNLVEQAADARVQHVTDLGNALLQGPAELRTAIQEAAAERERAFEAAAIAARRLAQARVNLKAIDRFKR